MSSTFGSFRFLVKESTTRETKTKGDEDKRDLDLHSHQTHHYKISTSTVRYGHSRPNLNKIRDKLWQLSKLERECTVRWVRKFWGPKPSTRPKLVRFHTSTTTLNLHVWFGKSSACTFLFQYFFSCDTLLLDPCTIESVCVNIIGTTSFTIFLITNQ